MQFDKINLGEDMGSFKEFPQYDGYSAVEITAEGETIGYYGTASGRVLTVECPLAGLVGGDRLAQNILESLSGYQYQPYVAAGAYIDPAAELGDGVTAAGVYGGMFAQKLNFSPAMTADISAPAEEETDHEYPFVPSQERSVRRRMQALASSLTVQYDRIALTVEELDESIHGNGGVISQLSVLNGAVSAKVDSRRDNASFGWELTATAWALKANGSEVLKATKDGITVTGKINATGGKIGGFDIGDSLTYGGQKWKGTVSKGIYIGASGIQLGKHFSVDNQGNLTASSGTFSGNIKAANLQGTIPSSAIGDNSIGKSKLSASVGTSLSRADTAAKVLSGEKKASAIYASTIFGEVGGSKVVLSFNTVDGKRIVGWNYI